MIWVEYILSCHLIYYEILKNLLNILNIYHYVQACRLFRIANEAKAFAHKTAAEAWARTEMALSSKFSTLSFYIF